MTTADRIKAERERQGLTQEDLAKRCGYQNKSSICKVEASGDEVTRKKLSKIADALNVSIFSLMGWEDAAAQGSQSAQVSSDRPAYYSDQDTADLAQAIYDSRELRLLFDAAKDAKAEDLEFTYEMLMRLKKKEDHDDDDAC